MSLVIGHQGAPMVAAGNTLASFRAARALGADGVELDVRRAAGGHLAVRHDAHLPDGRALADLPAGQLPESVPDLAAALDACAGLDVVNVEIKNWPADSDFDEGLAVAERVGAVLAGRPQDERDRVIVSCFHRPTIDRVRAVDADLATAWLVAWVPAVEAVVAEAVEHGHGAIHPFHGAVDAELVERAHDAGLAVNTWTCDEPDRIRWLADLGVDAVITNVPDVALEALGRTRP